MNVYENGKLIATWPKSLKQAKKMIAGLDESMACVDCDPQRYVVKDSKGKILFERK